MSIHLKYKKFAEWYQVGNQVHIVDFNTPNGKSSLGTIIGKTDILLTCQVKEGYKVSISFAELKSKRYGITVVNY